MIISNKRFPILLIAVLTLAGCDKGDDSHSKRRPVSPHLVETMMASIQPVSHQQVLSGTLEASISVKLHNEEAGRISTLPLHEGDAVTQGQTVAAMDSEMIKAELDKASAQHQQAIIDYKRLKKLLPKKLASEEEVARSLTTLNIAKAEAELQQLRMDRTQIRAPFDGVISQRNNEPGDTVSARSHILSLIQVDKLMVKVKVSAQWLTLINKGDIMQISIDAIGDASTPARVERIHPEIDPSTRKGTIELMLDPVPAQARAGQLARVHLKSHINDRLVIPAHAIHHDIDGAYIYLLEEIEDKTTVHKRYIKKGMQFGEWTEAISGIALNDTLITKGFLGLRDGKAVSIVNSPANPVDLIR